MNLNFIHPCNGFAFSIECFVCCAPPTTAGSSLGPSPGSRDNNFVELYAMMGLRGVYIASTVVEGVYLIKVN